MAAITLEHPIPRLFVQKVVEVEDGTFYDLTPDYTVIRDTRHVIDRDTGRTLAFLVKGALRGPKAVTAGREFSQFTKRTESLRYVAAGMKTTRVKIQYEDGTTNTYRKALGCFLNDGIMGYMDSSNFSLCRQTAMYRQHEKLFDASSVFVLQRLTKLFQKYCPKEYQAQLDFINRINPNMRLTKTCYTTVTVNRDFRTACHTDKGDYNSGLGNLLVFNVGDYTGGELLFPEYKLAVDIREGDCLFMDVHQHHCNNPIQGQGRVSLVCYAREGILKKCPSSTHEELHYGPSQRMQLNKITGKTSSRKKALQDKRDENK